MQQLATRKGSRSCVTHRKYQDLKNTMGIEKVLVRIAQDLAREMPRNFRLEMMVKKQLYVIQRQALLTTILLYNQLETNQA